MKATIYICDDKYWQMNILDTYSGISVFWGVSVNSYMLLSYIWDEIGNDLFDREDDY